MHITNELHLFQRSKRFLWTGSHIAKGMLSAHLDPNHDAASRNIHAIQKTIDWLETKIPKNGRILDLGCGPGLYALRLAQKGYSVVGIDISQNSLDYAKKQAEAAHLNIEYLCRDYVKEDIGTGYDAVLCIYCGIGALIQGEQNIVLKKIYNALNDGGVFIFDVFTLDIYKSKKERRNWYFCEGESFWSPNPCIVLEEIKHFPDHQAWGTRTIVVEKNKNPKEFITWDTYYSKEDIERLLSHYNFKVVSINEDIIDHSDFTSKDVMFIEAVKYKEYGFI